MLEQQRLEEQITFSQDDHFPTRNDFVKQPELIVIEEAQPPLYHYFLW